MFVKTYTINTRLLGDIAVTERNRTKEVGINFLKVVLGKKQFDQKYSVVMWYNMESFDNIYRVIQNNCRGFNNSSYTIDLR